MSIKQRRYLCIILICLAIYSVCFALYTRMVSVNKSLRYIRESMDTVGGHNSSIAVAQRTLVVGDSHSFSSLPNASHAQIHPAIKSTNVSQRIESAPKADEAHVYDRFGSEDSLRKMESYFSHGPQEPHQDGLQYPCLDRMATKYGRVEDVFCTALGKFESKFKNPCFYDYEHGGRRILRCLPYFYIIGPDKCGTTDLHSRMVNHPQLMDNDGIIRKEASFWGWRHFGMMNFKRWHRNDTTDFYMSLFRRTALLLETDPSKANVVTGDASPMDFYDFHEWRNTPQNWGKVEPEVLNPMLIRGLHAQGSHIPKMISQLRDPIERIFSLYVFLGGGNNPEKFHLDVLDSMEKLQSCIERTGRRLCFFDGPLFRSMRVKLPTSCYSVFIKEWLKAFPRSSFFITRMEDTSANMKKALTDIFNFLELEPLPEETMNRISERAKRHVTKAKVGVTMLPKTAELLREFYQPCNEELAKMLKDDRYLWNDVPHQ